jgi:hypothetical protein
MSGIELLAAMFKVTWKKCGAVEKRRQPSEVRGSRESSWLIRFLLPVVFLAFSGLLNLCEPKAPLLSSTQVFFFCCFHFESLPRTLNYAIKA